MLARVTSRASFGEGSPVLPVPAPKNSRSQSVSTSSEPLATARLLQAQRGDNDDDADRQIAGIKIIRGGGGGDAERS